MDKIPHLDRTRRPGARRHPRPSAKIDGAGADPRSEFSGTAGRPREAGGDVIGILPDENPDAANPHVTHVVATGIGQARNLAVVASADAVIAIGGEWGTLSEIAFARRLGRPVVALEGWAAVDAGPAGGGLGVELAIDPASAVELALRSRSL